MTGPRPGALLIDLDGTVHERGVLLEGSDKAVGELRDAGYTLRFCTNNDSQPLPEIQRVLAGYGLSVPCEELFTPVTAALTLLDGVPEASVLPLVSHALGEVFRPAADGRPVTHVLVGDCRDRLDYRLLDDAFRALRGGAELLALQRGRYFRSADGDHIDTGALVAALEYSAEVRARVLGKPTADFFALASASTGVPLERTVVVGDDATTDIAGGNDVGAVTVQVRTGKYRDQRAAGVSVPATHTIGSLADLPELLRGESAG